MDMSKLRWQATRDYYERLLHARGWSYRELARQIDPDLPPVTAVHRFFDPDHTYKRVPAILAGLDRVLGQPVGTGRHLLFDGLASNSEGFGSRIDLDAWEDEIRTGHYTAAGRKRLLARIKGMRAEMDLLRIDMDYEADTAGTRATAEGTQNARPVQKTTATRPKTGRGGGQRR